MLTHDYSYAGCLSDAIKVNWRVEDVLGPHKSLDFSKPFLPESLARTETTPLLSPRERLRLNQIRGQSYLHILSVAEHFILPFVLDQARLSMGEDLTQIRALATFADEEAKHMHLFARFREEFDSGFPVSCGRVGNVVEIARTVLAHHPLAVAITNLMLEWMTQRHYLGSVRDEGATDLDPLFVSLLRHHWLEEAQHAKLDTLVIQRLADTEGAAGVAKAFDDFLSIVSFLDETLAAQVTYDVDALSRVTDRAFSADQLADIKAVQSRAFRHTFLVSGMTHPNFVKPTSELSADGAARVAVLAQALT
jgi:hypothetical protein